MKMAEYFSSLAEILGRTETTDAQGGQLDPDVAAARVGEFILTANQLGRAVMLVGNGGSAAIAQHMQCDLVNSGHVRALAFYDAPMLTALSNDFGYASVFERNVELWGEAGGLLIAVSSSGKSENILRAVRAARAKSCNVVTLSGFASDNPLRKLGDINFHVPSDSYGFVELVHSAIGHFLAEAAALIARQPGAV